MTEWILGSTLAVLSLMVGVAGYFIQKWISAIEEAIKEHGGDLRILAQQVSTLEQTQTFATENLYEAIQSQVRSINVGPRFEQLEVIKEDVQMIRDTVRQRVLPQLEHQRESLGKVVVIDQRLSDQDAKLVNLFQVVKILADRIPRPPK